MRRQKNDAVQMRRALLCALVLTAALPALTSCGSESDGERHRIARLLSDGLTSQDPRVVCEGSLSPALLVRIYGSAAACRRTEGEPAERVSQAQSVDVHGVRVRGRDATAQVVIHGGNHDGARGALTLHRRQAGWRVSDLSVALLRSQFEAGIRRMQSIGASMKDCVVQKMRDLPAREFRQLAYRGGAAARQRLTDVARRCRALIAAAERSAL
jgi:hypothetical protein